MLPFEFNATFAIIDDNLITNLYIPSNLNILVTRIFNKFGTVYSHHNQTKTLVISYFIKAKKFYQMVFASTNLFNSSWFIFDGPGFTSPILGPKKEVTTTAFQCIVQFIFKSKTIPTTDQVDFTHQPKNISQSQTISIEKGVIRYFDLSHNTIWNKLSIILIKVKKGLQINVTVLNIVSSHSQSSECVDWGFLTVEYLDRKYEESAPICSKHNGTLAASRNFYSVNSSLIILFYLYQGSGKVNISGVMSTTKCKPLHFDPCIYYLSAKQCKSVPNFKAYLINITKYVNISLTSEHHIRDLDHANLFLSLLDTQCIVIQIGNKAIHIFDLDDDYLRCSLSYAMGCSTMLSVFDSKSIIYSVKGHITDKKINILYTLHSIVSVSHLNEKSNVITNVYGPENRTFELTFHDGVSVKIRQAFLARILNWIDMVILTRKESLPTYLQYVAYLHSGINIMPSIEDHGMKTFADGDIALKLSNSWLRHITLYTLLYNMSLNVQIIKSILLHHQNYFVSQRMYLFSLYFYMKSQ